jgi:hypothetical protein
VAAACGSRAAASHAPAPASAEGQHSSFHTMSLACRSTLMPESGRHAVLLCVLQSSGHLVHRHIWSQHACHYSRWPIKGQRAWSAGPPWLQGHAFEARVYAESPTKSFMPSPGTIASWRVPPGSVAFTHAGDVRVDSGVQQGDQVRAWIIPACSLFSPLLAPHQRKCCSNRAISAGSARLMPG